SRGASPACLQTAGPPGTTTRARHKPPVVAEDLHAENDIAGLRLAHSDRSAAFRADLRTAHAMIGSCRSIGVTPRRPGVAGHQIATNPATCLGQSWNGAWGLWDGVPSSCHRSADACP